jgi:hypothetical protein
MDRPGSALSTMMRQLGTPVQRPNWFDPAITAVLDQGHVVLDAQHPRALEQLTSQLIGAQLHQAIVAENAGLWFDRWFIELLSATESRVREQANGGAWEAPLRLLHGLAAIGTPGQAQTALAAANRLRKLIGRAPGQDPGPRWPLDVLRLKADGDVVRLRDVWGTRYAVIAGYSYGGRDRSVFLFDVDTDFFNIVVGAGAFDDTGQAVAAWRQKLGDSAADARIQPVEHIDQLDCLVHLDMDEAALPATPDRSVTDHWFSAQRRLAELRAALHGPAHLRSRPPRCSTCSPGRRSTSSRGGLPGGTAPNPTARPPKPWPTSGCPASSPKRGSRSPRRGCTTSAS